MTYRGGWPACSQSWFTSFFSSIMRSSRPTMVRFKSRQFLIRGPQRLFHLLALGDVHEQRGKLARREAIGKHFIVPLERRRIVFEMCRLAGQSHLAVYLDP